MSYYFIEQFPVLPPSAYSAAGLAFITPRVLELTYTSHSLNAWAEDLGYDGPPFTWNPERRALLRAELDAYIAHLYGLSRNELRYILDPADVLGEDYPSETFRVLKNNEMKEFGGYRTQRLVLEAWDRFAADGTFDRDKLAEAEASCVITPMMKEREAAMPAPPVDLAALRAERDALLAQIADQQRPILYVEGVTDVQILKAAWDIFAPGGKLSCEIRPAGGTRQMQILAARGNTFHDLLSEKPICALADNDREGRELVKEKGQLKAGGRWLALPNGVHWCLLEPTREFTDVMNRVQVPKDFRPFTIEACFSAELRRQARQERAYSFSDKMQAELTANSELAQRMFGVLRGMSEDDDAYFYLMAPAADAKEPFAEWITAPGRCTPENYAAFEPIVTGLKNLLEEQGASGPAKGKRRRKDDSGDLFESNGNAA